MEGQIRDSFQMMSGIANEFQREYLNPQEPAPNMPHVCAEGVG